MGISAEYSCVLNKCFVFYGLDWNEVRIFYTKPLSYVLISLHPFIKGELFYFGGREEHFFQGFA